MTPEDKFCSKHPNVRLASPDCGRCGGDGYVDAEDDFGNPDGGFEPCSSCRGTGIAPWLTCEWCDEDAMEEMNNEEYA